MHSFNELWTLLRQHGSSNKRESECAQLWESYSPELRDLLFETIRKKVEQHKFVHYDPVRAMEENVQALRSQTLSFHAYYGRYHTTEERDGWKMVKPINPGDPPVHYVRAGW